MKQHYFRRTTESITTPISEATLRHELRHYDNPSDPPSYENSEGCWLVVGRCEGDDDASMLTVWASSEAAAVYAFELFMVEVYGHSRDENDDDYAQVFVEMTARSETKINIVFAQGF